MVYSILLHKLLQLIWVLNRFLLRFVAHLVLWYFYASRCISIYSISASGHGVPTRVGSLFCNIKYHCKYCQLIRVCVQPTPLANACRCDSCLMWSNYLCTENNICGGQVKVWLVDCNFSIQSNCIWAVLLAVTSTKSVHEKSVITQYKWHLVMRKLWNIKKLNNGVIIGKFWLIFITYLSDAQPGQRPALIDMVTFCPRCLWHYWHWHWHWHWIGMDIGFSWGQFVASIGMDQSWLRCAFISNTSTTATMEFFLQQTTGSRSIAAGKRFLPNLGVQQGEDAACQCKKTKRQHQLVEVRFCQGRTVWKSIQRESTKHRVDAFQAVLAIVADYCPWWCIAAVTINITITVANGRRDWAADAIAWRGNGDGLTSQHPSKYSTGVGVVVTPPQAVCFRLFVGAGFWRLRCWAKEAQQLHPVPMHAWMQPWVVAVPGLTDQHKLGWQRCFWDCGFPFCGLPTLCCKRHNGWYRKHNVLTRSPFLLCRVG